MKAVIFDMDGLMFDTEQIYVKAWDYAGEKMGVGKAGFMGIRTLGVSMAMSYQMWKEEFGEKFNAEKLEKYTKEFFENYFAEYGVPVKKGLYVLLDYLKEKGYKIAVASSSPRELVVGNLKDTKVYDYFQAVICGDMIEKSKPEPDIYLKACELLQEKPEECFALEDSKNGLISAYRAGCKTIMIPDLWQADETVEGILFAKFEDLEQVKEFLEKQD